MATYKYVINPHTGRLQKVLSNDYIQSLDPKEHTHTESEITDLDHDAQKIKGKEIDDSAIDTDKYLKYDGEKIVYDTPSEGGAVSGVRVRVYLSSFQSIPNDTGTKVLFNVKEWDINDEFVNSTFTAKEEGYYEIQSELLFFNPGANKLLSLAVKKNDEFIKSRYEASNGLYEIDSIETYTVAYLNIGDTIEIWAQHQVGTSVNLLGVPSPQSSNMIINKI